MRNKLYLSLALFTLFIFMVSTTVSAATSISSSTNSVVEVNDLVELEAALQEELAKKPQEITILYTAKGPTNSTSYLQGVKDTIHEAQSGLAEELFWNMKSFTYSMKGSIGKLKITLHPEYLTTLEQDQYVDEEVDRILSEIITAKMTPFEKELAIHDFVVSHTSYEDVGEIGHTAYSALYNKKAVCQGYAILTNLLLNKAGITSHLIVGYINDDVEQPHMWNEVNIEDNWYMLDTVFNDSTSNPSMDYYNVTSKALKGMKHTWEESDYPVAETEYK
ncbi:transglutaminase domain-containing protein [Paenibacillus qinlingensis]|uniref:Transglutaminase/protease-like cytokinesis protein 3 n=1 Tax=Paenibacillus qinlingensis TaxID=1837343 RepID=A0ABU1P5V3_9BACL|nr:transglutaminase domain-containing protein [Paenibacillus qinlingensis]MDR6555135.1 transglutaminase/protease-like cytokinesis protein 3 [Paenibacillus qinlingensis]